MSGKIAKIALAGVAAIALAAGAAWAGGYYTNGLPLAGSATYPTTLPLTGNEQFPADTELSGGVSPQSEGITTGQMAGFVQSRAGSAGFRNALIGGDFGTNPWQRGTTSSSITTVAAYTADQWVAISGTGTAFTVIKETGATDITSGFAASARVQRTASQTGVLPICIGQPLISANSTRFQGQVAEFSVHMLAGANFSSAASNVNMVITTGTGSSESAASFITSPATWTGVSETTQATTIGTTWAKYSAVATIPAGATQIGVKLCYTPVGTAGANDWFEFTGAQLAVNPAAVAANGTSGAAYNYSSFERRPAGLELALAQYYLQVINEPAASISVGPSGQGASTTTCVLSIPLPTSMRVAPTVTFTGTSLSTSTWTVTHVVTNTALATPFLAATTGGSTVNSLNVTATVASGLTAGQTCTLTGAGGAASITASAEL